MITLIASASEIGLATLTAFFIRNGLAKDIFLKLAATLPKILAMLVVMAIYSLQLALASTVLTALACGTYYLLERGRRRIESAERLVVSSDLLPLSFRLPLTLIVLFILWYGTSFVLNAQLTLGQLIALSIFNIQFVSSLLSLVATATKDQKRHEAVEPIQ